MGDCMSKKAASEPSSTRPGSELYREQKLEEDQEHKNEGKIPPPPEPGTKPELEKDRNSADEEMASNLPLFTYESSDFDKWEIEKTFSCYPKVMPMEEDSKVKKGSDIQWFPNWKAQMDEHITDFVEKDSVQGNGLRTQHDVDRHAREAPTYLNKNFDELIAYLTNDLEYSDRPEVFKARALIVWLSNQDVDSPDVKRRKGHSESPEGYITLLAQNECTYSTFYTVLCRKANIQCAQITGICKAGSYQPGDRDIEDYNSLWNAIYVEGTWQIVHPYWVCRCLVGHTTGGWIKLEADGKSIGKKQQERTGVVQNTFAEYFFMTNPAEFIYLCHSDIPEWQLCSNPISRECFIEQAYLLPPFFGLGLILKTADSCVYNSENGQVKIILSAPAKNANAIDLWYDILLKKGSADQDMESNFLLSPENIPRIVAMLRCGERWNIRVNFPTEGTYKLCLYGRANKGHFLCLAEFRLDCKLKKRDFIPLPIDPKSIGFGPGPEAERAGLLFPSHRDGLYPIQKGKYMQFSFHLAEEVVERIDARATLYMSTIVDGQNVQQEFRHLGESEVRKRKRDIRFKVKVTGDGEFCLSILVKSMNSTKEYKNVCNYLLTTTAEWNEEEKNLWQAKEKLRQLLDETDPVTRDEMKKAITDIDTAVNVCLNERVPEDDEVLKSAKIRMEYLEARIEIHDTKLQENLDATEKIIKRLKQSRFAVILGRSINELTELKNKQTQRRAQEQDREERTQTQAQEQERGERTQRRDQEQERGERTQTQAQEQERGERTQERRPGRKRRQKTTLRMMSDIIVELTLSNSLTKSEV